MGTEAKGGVTPSAEEGRRMAEEWQMEEVLEGEEMGREEPEETGSEGETDGAAEPDETEAEVEAVVTEIVVVGFPPLEQEEVRE